MSLVVSILFVLALFTLLGLSAWAVVLLNDRQTVSARPSAVRKDSRELIGV